MNPIQQPSATPAPIHDIAGAFWFLPYPLWSVILAAIVLIAVIGWGAWYFIVRRKPARQLTPRERALKVIESFRGKTAGADPYQFGVQVSDALRVYIREQHGVEATTKTSIEFLESIQDNPVFSPNEKASLAGFLEGTDLLKFARLRADGTELQELLDSAERLIRGEGRPETKAA